MDNSLRLSEGKEGGREVDQDKERKKKRKENPKSERASILIVVF